jgi:hypothetical protein
MKLRLALVALVLALASSPAAAFTVDYFRTPSRNIYCARIPNNFLRCDVRHLAHPAPRPRGCQFDYGNSFGMTPRGRAHALCVSDSVIDPHAVVLRYGTTRRFGPFVCRSRTIGLRCTNRVRHGFFLNRTNYRLF